MTMNTDQARLVNPVLTAMAQGYRHPTHVGHRLFPEVTVRARGGNVIEFGKESFQAYNLRRAPGAATVRVQFGYEGKPFTLSQDSAEIPVPFEHMQDAAGVAGIDLASRAIDTNFKILTLQLEIEQARLALDEANYAGNHVSEPSAADKWSDPGSQPTSQIDDLKDRIRMQIGIDPNTLLLGPTAYRSLRNHPAVVERFVHTTADSITAAMLAEMLDIRNVVVGRALYVPEDGGAPVDVWGNNAILAYAPDVPSTEEEPSFGYTYTLEGHPNVEDPYVDRRHQSWIFPVTYDRAPVVTSNVAGVLIKAPA